MKCKQRGNTHEQKLIGMTKRNVKREEIHACKIRKGWKQENVKRKKTHMYKVKGIEKCNVKREKTNMQKVTGMEWV